MTAAQVADRIHAFERELWRRCSTRTEPTRFGTAFLNEDFPLRYDSNFVRVERPLAGVDAVDLAADADRVLGGAGLGHRELSIADDDEGQRLAPAFLELDWSADRLVSMVWRREPEPRPAVEVRQVAFEDARPAIEATLRARHDIEGPDELAQLVTFRGLLERRVGARFFVAEVDGRPAGVCEMYSFDGVSEIEDVNTLEEFRGRGLASAVVLAAARAARRAGNDLVFLIADESDWPKELYARLGFDPVDRSWSLLRPPGGAG